MKKTKDHIRMLIAKAELRQAADILVEYCLDISAEYRDIAILLSQRLYKLDKETRSRGTVGVLEACQVYNIITSGMLDLLRELDENHTGEAA